METKTNIEGRATPDAVAAVSSVGALAGAVVASLPCLLPVASAALGVGGFAGLGRMTSLRTPALVLITRSCWA